MKLQVTRTKAIPNTGLLFILIAPFAVIYYAIYVYNPGNAGNLFLYVLQLVADTLAIIIVGSLWVTIILDLLQPEYHKREMKDGEAWVRKHKPTVDVLIPTANEPFHIVKETIIAASRLDYPHRTVVLDDGDSTQLRQLAKELNVEYIHRSAGLMAKAGNLNNGLKHCKGEFFAVFDADHVPKKEFISELLPLFENENVALLQTPQYYTNTENYIASGTAQAQELFYKYVQPAKNSYNSSFCVGTNMLYRRSAIDAVGGIAMLDHSEDIWTTIQLHEMGFESIFYNKILAEGRAPDDIASYFRQQNRWARGGFSLFFTHNPLFLKNLTLDQRLQYFLSNIHYFSGFAIVIYLVLPIIYLLFGVNAMNIVHSQEWLLHYIPFFICVYFLPFFLLGNMKVATLSTSLSAFYPYLQAFFSTIFKNSYTWIATESKGDKKLSVIMFYIWPHVLLIILGLLSIIIGWYNIVDFPSTLATTFWVLINVTLLFTFINKGIKTV